MHSILLLPVFNNNKIRHSIRIICAIFIALITNYYFSFTDEGWIIMAAAFVMLTTVGSALYQGLLRFFLLASLVTVASLLFSSITALTLRLNDIAIGAFIGIAANIIILPDRVDVEFRSTLGPLLQSYGAYFSGIIELLLKNNQKNAEIAKIQVEKELLHLPIWVYEVGFDIRMQKGYRYFFMKISQISEILFALHYLARHPFDVKLLERTHDVFIQCVLKVNQFILALMTVLELKKLTEGVDDFEEEIALIENEFKKIAPISLELLDIEKASVYFVEFSYALKELHSSLVSLAKALR